MLMKAKSSHRKLLLDLNWGQALKQAPILGEFEDSLGTHPPPTAFVVKTTELNGLIPSTFAHFPVAYFRLHAGLQSMLAQLSSATLTACNLSSDDLLNNETYGNLNCDAGTLTFREAPFVDALNKAFGVGALLVLYRCADRVLLSKVKVDDAVISDFQGCNSCAGRNYKPYRIWPEEELAAVAGQTETVIPSSTWNDRPLVVVESLWRDWQR